METTGSRMRAVAAYPANAANAAIRSDRGYIACGTSAYNDSCGSGIVTDEPSGVRRAANTSCSAVTCRGRSS